MKNMSHIFLHNFRIQSFSSTVQNFLELGHASRAKFEGRECAHGGAQACRLRRRQSCRPPCCPVAPAKCTTVCPSSPHTLLTSSSSTSRPASPLQAELLLCSTAYAMDRWSLRRPRTLPIGPPHPFCHARSQSTQACTRGLARAPAELLRPAASGHQGHHDGH